MGWLIALCARLAFLVLWLSTPLVHRAFHEGWLLPLLGVLLLPFTALSYVLVFALSGSVSGAGWLWVVMGFVLDLAAHATPAGQATGGKKQA